MPERRVSVQARVRTAVPDDLRVLVDDRSVQPFRVDLLTEHLDEDGVYDAWVSGPRQTKTQRDHARQTGIKTVGAVDQLPAELQPLALGPAGLRGVLAEAARGGEGA